MIPRNFLLEADSYKLTHFEMMLAETIGSHSHFMARPGGDFDRVMHNGLQPHLHDIAGQQVTRDAIEEARELQSWHMPGTQFNHEGWNYILSKHGGRLPLRINSAPEGLILPAGVPLMTVDNTDHCRQTAFLPDFIETKLSKVWYPIVVGTLSWHVKQDMLAAVAKSGGPIEAVDFMLQDFAYRGVPDELAAQIGGCAHLFNYKGTDTIAAIRHAIHYYGAIRPAFSCAASQHSIMTRKGESGEKGTAHHIINSHPNQLVSLVGDSYDYKRFVDYMIDSYEIVQGRRVQLVIRPDSVCAPFKTPAEVVVWTMARMADRLKCETTPTGHRITPYAVLYGDALEYRHPVNEIRKILTAIVDAGFAAHRFVAGMGGGLLQKVNRDTIRAKYAASALLDFPEKTTWRPIAKTTPGKASQGGRLTTYYNPQTRSYYAAADDILTRDAKVLVPTFENGVILKQYTFDEVRERAATSAKLMGDYLDPIAIGTAAVATA